MSYGQGYPLEAAVGGVALAFEHCDEQEAEDDEQENKQADDNEIEHRVLPECADCECVSLARFLLRDVGIVDGVGGVGLFLHKVW